MPKPRAPISTRLRNRDKNGVRIPTPQVSPEKEREKKQPVTKPVKAIKKEEFSPKKHPEIYMDELQTPLSFVRGSEEERHRFLMEEDAVMSHSFGSDYKSIQTSTFYLARVTPPVPSKRTRHLKIQTPKYVSDTLTLTPSPTATRYTTTCSPSPSISSSSLSPTPTPTPTPTPSIKKSKPSIKRKRKTVDDSEGETTVPLPLSSKLPVYIKMDAKEKEREYWRRQRRVFVNSRFLTNEEGVVVAKTVYSNLSIQPDNRMVTSFQGNIGNFRTKLRRTFSSQAHRYNMTREYMMQTDKEEMMNMLQSKMGQQELEAIWDHWITDPFVDTKTLYADKEAVELLKDITAQLMIVSMKEQYAILSPKQARTEMRKIDMISRTLILPDSSIYR
ncbi:uncharacterized protein EV154DRAFT_505885 [Mucor mucedo]|uniref:uncharacterized protein n=1 Tax=Mucor mucedo TaxID=29922 RepID=UPI00221F0004|nr:uncharacterized protein EV154DRAFT_505885 [Mucor mucedo]KAI7892178.1 hypothetical protein EV154DRAFT_505885 [Mucor mucedo]